MSSKDWTMNCEESCLLREDSEGEGVFFLRLSSVVNFVKSSSGTRYHTCIVGH
jgi:hypothetical protein